jgi:DHA1 family multidrug resistance protein-like MFS transporter
MDIVDRDLERAETQASREWSREASRERQRRGSQSSSSTSSSSSIDSEVARATTNDLSQHPTHVERVHTHRLQHSHTVGASITSRVSKKPLPEFGAGKPYPPPLPEREEYVVEFSGPDDPMHPQNWPNKRKYGPIQPRISPCLHAFIER